MDKVYAVWSGQYSGKEIHVVSRDKALCDKYAAIQDEECRYDEFRVEGDLIPLLQEEADLDYHIYYSLSYYFKYYASPTKWEKKEAQSRIFPWEDPYAATTKVIKSPWDRDFTKKYPQEVWSTLYSLNVTGTNFEEVHKIFGEQETLLSNRILEIGDQPALTWS